MPAVALDPSGGRGIMPAMGHEAASARTDAALAAGASAATDAAYVRRIVARSESSFLWGMRILVLGLAW